MSGTKRHIFLIGPSGVGKTTIAQSVAHSLGRTSVDLDDVITENVKMSISKYFADYGETAFREEERQALLEVCARVDPIICATGGGTVLDSRNIVTMKEVGVVVYLSALEKDIIERLSNESEHERPLLADDVEWKVHEQLITRQGSYELAADITIATSRRDIETVTEAVVRQVHRSTGETVDLASAIVVGDHILENAAQYVSGYGVAVVISQKSIPEKYRKAVIDSLAGNGTRVVQCIVPEGEEAKTFSSYEEVINTMAQERVPRSGCVVAVGGGVVGDLSGYVAASYHRGIDVIQVPTTLLAQIDSSIGGKCGINLKGGKNLVGAFHQPKVILADTSVLETLPQSDFLSGLGEATKYALLGNLTVSELIEQSADAILAKDENVLIPLIRSCMNHKLHVVAQDPYERNGLRATLNLGHTLAHAIETSTDYSIAHGIAVAIGLRFAAKLSCALGRISQKQCDDAIALIDALGLETSIPPAARDPKKLVELMYSDKKSDGGLSMILFIDGGGAELVHNVDPDIVEKTLAEFIG
jgi:3-dehydroquinate synthase